MIFEMTEKQYQLFLHVMQVMQTFYGNNFSSICKEIGDAYGVNDADIEKAYMIFTDFKVTAPVPTMQNAAGEIIGAFTCEDIDQLNCLTGLSPYYADGEKLSGMADKFIRESCIDIAALFEYGNKTGMLYGWNISNVRKLSLPMHQLHLKRAPQSWQYINLNADDIESVAAAIE